MLRLFQQKRRDPAAALRDLLGGHELPTFPAIVTQALELLRDEHASHDAVGDLIGRDPGLTARLLRTVNSAAFALKHRVRNLRHAVSLLGRGQVESMLISLAVGKTLPARPTHGYRRLRFWHTAARRAATASALAEIVDPSRRSESFTAALLQDMALPVLAQHRGEEYGPVLDAWHGGDGDLARLERELFDWDHAEVATWMASGWKFPELLSEAIGAHHGTALPGTRELPAVQLVAVLREVNEGLGFEQLVERARQDYHIPEDRAWAALRAGGEAAEDIVRLFA